MMDLGLRRRFFAEELQAVCNFRSPGLVDAFAAVPRERFLAPGPWTVLGDAGDGFMMGGPPKHRTTPDADPAHVYHNVAIAIDAQQLPPIRVKGDGEHLEITIPNRARIDHEHLHACAGLPGD